MRPKVTGTRSDVRSLVTALTLVDVDINISLLSLQRQLPISGREATRSIARSTLPLLCTFEVGHGTIGTTECTQDGDKGDRSRST